MKPIKINWIPAYTVNAASTRIRVYNPHNSINRYYGDEFISNIGYDPAGDVLIIQKEITPENIEYVTNFKGLKIYDYDDPMSHRWGYKEMISKVDIVMTDTLGRKLDFENEKHNTPCFVVPDCLDYDIQEKLTPNKNIVKTISWFGNHPNIQSIMWMFDPIIKNDYKINIISDIEHFPKDVHPNVNLIKWKLDTFISNLQLANSCVLSHRGDGHGVKSNNKMLVAIACGVPCIISDSNSYEQLAKQFNLDAFIVKTESELLNALNLLENPNNRIDYLKDIQDYVLNTYSSKNTTRVLLDLIKNKL